MHELLLIVQLWVNLKTGIKSLASNNNKAVHSVNLPVYFSSLL